MKSTLHASRRVVRGMVAIFVVLGPTLLVEPGWSQETRKSSPEALNLYGDAASFQNNGAFEIATEEWEKFLKLYPEDPLVDKARHYAGVCQLQLKQFEKAAQHFSGVVAKGKSFELAEDAYLNLAWCQYSLGGQGKPELYDKAAESFEALVKAFPTGKYAGQARFYQGEALYAQGKKKEAAAAYKDFVEKHPDSALRCDGLYALGVTFEELKDYQQAGVVYDGFLKGCADNRLVNEVRMRKAETVLQSGKVAEAEKMFAEIAAIPNFESADHAVYRQAFCAARQDEFARAGQLYARLATEFPQSAYAAGAPLSAGRAFYRGQDFDQAAQWLRRIVEDAGEDVPEAAHWLCRIYLRSKDAAEVVQLVDRILQQAEGSPYEISLRMDQADALYALSEWREMSIDKYLGIVADDPEHELAPQALYNAAFTCWETGKFKDGLQHAAAFLEKFSADDLVADVKHVAAECHLKQEDYAAAETLYRELVKDHAEHESSRPWRVRLGLVLYLEKKYGETITVLAEALPGLQEKNDIAEAQFLMGVSQFYQNQPSDAEKSLAASLAASAKWRQADETLLFLSRAQFKLEKTPAALATVGQLIAGFPQSELLDHAYYRLGEFSYAANDFQAAVAAYDTLLDRWPKSLFTPYALYGLGWSQLKSQDYSAAVDSFSALVDQHPQHELVGDALFARAMSRRQLGQYQEAIDDVDAYLKSDPSAKGQADALYERGLAEIAKEDFTGAVKSFEQLLAQHKESPNEANVLYELAWAYRQLDKKAESVSTFQRLTSEHPDHPLAAEAFWRVGEDFFDKGQYAKAAEQYSQAKQKAAAGDVAELAAHKLGWCHFREDEFETALEQFRDQAKAHPDGELVADALFMQGECLYELGNFEEALPIFTAASRTKPTKPQMQVLTLLHGGQSAAEMKQWETSLQLLDQIPAKFPQTPLLAEALGKRGLAKQNLKRTEEAIQDYEQAAAKSRGEPGAHARFLLGEILFEQKKYNEAVKSFLRVMYGFGGDNATDEVKHWQAMAGYEAGRCVEVQIKNSKDAQQRSKLIADAKTYFQFVVQRHGGHELAGQAKDRLKALTQL